MPESEPWMTLVFDQTRSLILRLCPECSATVPAFEAAVLNHERWHRRFDKTGES